MIKITTYIITLILEISLGQQADSSLLKTEMEVFEKTTLLSNSEPCNQKANSSL